MMIIWFRLFQFFSFFFEFVCCIIKRIRNGRKVYHNRYFYLIIMMKACEMKIAITKTHAYTIDNWFEWKKNQNEDSRLNNFKITDLTIRKKEQ